MDLALSGSPDKDRVQLPSQHSFLMSYYRDTTGQKVHEEPQFKLSSPYLEIGLVPGSSYVFTQVRRLLPVKRKREKTPPYSLTHTRICPVHCVQ